MSQVSLQGNNGRRLESSNPQLGEVGRVGGDDSDDASSLISAHQQQPAAWFAGSAAAATDPSGSSEHYPKSLVNGDNGRRMLLAQQPPAKLSWRTPYDGLIAPVLLVGGSGGTQSTDYFDRCNNMVFVSSISGVCSSLIEYLS